MSLYLNTEDAAAYLGIKERKLYDLVASGSVPCSKVTGKWLFPRDALDRWIESGLVHPNSFSPLAPPPIIGGSHDLLLEWAARHSNSGLALLSEGSMAGLDRLDRNEIQIAAIHIHEAVMSKIQTDNANVVVVQNYPQLADVVVIAFARREQGLLTAPQNPLRLRTLSDVAATRARLGIRQSGAGAQLLLDQLAQRAGLSLDIFNSIGSAFATGQDLAFAVRSNEIDCGIATRAVAVANGLEFAPLAWEHFDLVMRRRNYFEPGPQRLLALMREPEFQRHAELLSGYDVSQAGCVHLNR